MKMPIVSLLDWQKQFGTEKACAKTLIKVRHVDLKNLVLLQVENCTNARHVVTRYR